MTAFLIRFILALILVFSTWNPWGVSYLHWLIRSVPQVTAPLAFTGVVLLIGWIMFLHATLDALGILGIVLAAAFFGTFTWLLLDMGWLSTQGGWLTSIALVLIAAVLAVGMSWSHIWRRLSGQVSVEEHDD